MSKKQTENYTIIGLLGVTGLAGALLSLPTASADTSSSANIGITVSEVCSMTASPNGSNDSPHTAELNPGTYQANIGKTTIQTKCNDSNGFSIYAIGYTNNEYGNTTLRPSTLDPTGNSIITGTATSAGNPDTSNWAMKISAVAGTYAPTIQSDANGNFSSYHIVPSTYTKIASGSSVTDATIGSSIEATYAAYISSEQPADTYNGKVKYTLVHPASEEPILPQSCTPGKICYHANASDAVGTMGEQDMLLSSYTKDWSQCTNGTDYDYFCYDSSWNNIFSSLPESNYATIPALLASNYSRTGYGFAGWSDSFDYATNPNAHFYGPQENITVNTEDYTGNNDGLSLYAVWVRSTGSLQDSAKVNQLCGTGAGSLTVAPTNGTANLSSVSALTDQRDNQTYAIAKLADGKCWMIENLRLESTAAHNSDGTLAQGYGSSTIYGDFSGLAIAESADFTRSTTANSLYYSDTQSGIATIDVGTSDNPGYRIPRYNNWNNQSASSNRPQNPTNNDDINSTSNASIYSYGNYYTWHAAIADLTYYDTNNQSITNTSLCPSGWHLPTGGAGYGSNYSIIYGTPGVNETGDTSSFRDFYYLSYELMDEVKTAQEDNSNYGASYYSFTRATNSIGKTADMAFRSFPNNFLYSGNLGNSSAYLRGINGFYWTSTVGKKGYDGNSNVIDNAYYLRLNGGSLAPGTYFSDPGSGFSIRCVSGS